jgi:hypothetical protein
MSKARNPKSEAPITVHNRLTTVVNPEAAHDFFANLLRIVDRIEREREEANGRPANGKDSREK